jgi:hypothetical protein
MGTDRTVIELVGQAPRFRRGARLAAKHETFLATPEVTAGALV